MKEIISNIKGRKEFKKLRVAKVPQITSYKKYLAVQEI